jgi:hypothetical protein
MHAHGQILGSVAAAADAAGKRKSHFALIAAVLEGIPAAAAAYEAAASIAAGDISAAVVAAAERVVQLEGVAAPSRTILRGALVSLLAEAFDSPSWQLLTLPMHPELALLTLNHVLGDIKTPQLGADRAIFQRIPPQ